MSTPNSEIRFGWVPLSKPEGGANFTRYFSSQSEQQSWMFSRLTRYIQSNYEVRPYSGSFRVNAYPDSIMTYNYCAFRNGSTNMWWYAFIDRVVYVNENVAEIQFTVDDLQTFHFGYTPEAVYVEREHAANDAIGANILDEPVSTGELMYAVSDDYTAMRVMDYIVECNEEPVGATQPDTGVQKKPCKTGKVNGMYSGCGKFYFSSDVTEPSQAENLNDFLESMNKAGCGSSIVSIYGVPHPLFAGNFNNNQNIFESNQNIEINPDQYSVDVSPHSTLGGYTPHNNKLYTYPFNFLRVTNNGSNYHDYRFEFFADPNSISFYIVGALDPTGDTMAYPAGVYNGKNANRDEHVMLGGNPQCSWAYNSYQNWVAQNASGNMLAFVTGAATVIGGVAATVGTGGAAAPVAAESIAGVVGASTIASGASQVAGTAATYLDAQRAPNKQMGVTTNSTNVQLSMNNFTFMRMCCQPDIAARIDRFFDTYGYTTQTVKVPDRTSRAHVNYTKTRNADFQGQVPAQSMAHINRMYDEGIWWFHDDNIGDFTVSNPIA